MTARTAWSRALGLAVVLIAVDQAVKALVIGAVERGDEASIFFGIKLVNVRNSGIAFGALQDGGVIVALAVIGATSALLVYFALNATRRWAWLPVGMLLGGAIGNAIDRIAHGAVVDFVKLPAWPAFNVADASITFGVILLLIVIEEIGPAKRRAGGERSDGAPDRA